MKLRALVAHEHKMDIVLQDLQAECDSSTESTLRYRADSLEAALEMKQPLRPKAVKTKADKGQTHKSSDLLHPSNHAHQQPRHHHQHAQP
jgi:hypothetical protein